MNISKNDLKLGLGILSMSAMFFGTYAYISANSYKPLSKEYYEEKAIEEEHESIALENMTREIVKETFVAETSETETVTELETTTEIETTTEVETTIPADEIKVYTLYGTDTITTEEFNLMCRVVMNEAGGDNYTCQVAVAETIINRVNSEYYPNTISDVLWQPYQYSHHENGAVTDSVAEAVTQALETKVFDDNMVYFRDDYYFSFAEDYFNENGMYFSKRRD